MTASTTSELTALLPHDRDALLILADRLYDRGDPDADLLRRMHAGTAVDWVLGKCRQGSQRRTDNGKFPVYFDESADGATFSLVRKPNWQLARNLSRWLIAAEMHEELGRLWCEAWGQEPLVIQVGNAGWMVHRNGLPSLIATSWLQLYMSRQAAYQAAYKSVGDAMLSNAYPLKFPDEAEDCGYGL